MMLMSHEVMKAMEKDHAVDISVGYSEDMYALGYCIVYAMGLGKISYSEADPIKRHEKVAASLAKSGQYSENLLKMVLSMIEPSTSKRIIVDHLR